MAETLNKPEHPEHFDVHHENGEALICMSSGGECSTLVEIAAGYSPEEEQQLIASTTSALEAVDRFTGGRAADIFTGLHIKLGEDETESGGALPEESLIVLNGRKMLMSVAEMRTVSGGYSDEELTDFPDVNRPGGALEYVLVHEVGHILDGVDVDGKHPFRVSPSESPTNYGRVPDEYHDEKYHEAFAEGFAHAVYGMPISETMEAVVRETIDARIQEIAESQANAIKAVGTDIESRPADITYAFEMANGLAQVIASQESTRGDGTVELTGEPFTRENVDFGGVIDHLAIHQDGAVAGSQFNGELFPDAQSVVSFLTEALPVSMRFDQHGMAEITLDVQLPNQEMLGFSGVKSVSELEADGVVVESGVRTPGGEAAVEDGLVGAWYPEMVRDPESGRFVVKTDENGEVANPHGKFEPEANIATVTDSEVAATSKVSVVLRRDQETGRAVVLTAYPGEIAPPFPSKITTEAFSADSLQGSTADYWKQHAFIKFIQ